LVFVDADENSIVADDVITPSNPLVALVEEKELQEASLNVNVSQRLCEKEPFRKVVHI
jgi:hypothetical protein